MADDLTRGFDDYRRPSRFGRPSEPRKPLFDIPYEGTQQLDRLARGFSENVSEPLRRQGLLSYDAPEEPLGDFARRQGMIEQEEIENGAHEALASSPEFADALGGATTTARSAAPREEMPNFQDALAGGSSSGPGVSSGASSAAQSSSPPPPPPAAPAPREPLSVRYKDREGNWKTHTLGQAPPTDIARSTTAFDPTEAGGGAVESIQPVSAPGQSRNWRNSPGMRAIEGVDDSAAITGGGGFTPSAVLDESPESLAAVPLGQRPPSYFETDALRTGLAESAAQRKLAETLAGDPFAREKAGAEIDVRKAGATYGIQSELRVAEERRRQEGYLGEARRLSQRRDQEIAKGAALPPDDPRRVQLEQGAQEIFESEMLQLRESFGFGARLGQAVTGR